MVHLTLRIHLTDIHVSVLLPDTLLSFTQHDLLVQARNTDDDAQRRFADLHVVESDNGNQDEHNSHRDLQFIIPRPRGIRVAQLPNNTAFFRMNGLFDPLEEKFPLRQDFTFPQPEAVQPLTELRTAKWIQSLRQHVDALESKEIILATSNSEYRDVLLNWLISATVRSAIPLSSILVVSLDADLHRLLRWKRIPSVLLPPDSLLSPFAYFSEPFERVMMTRLAVMRLLNHWGFDVANYDTDAVILRDPKPLYETLTGSDIIGSVGKIPVDLVQEWGITICIGVVVIKSSERTGKKTELSNIIYRE